MVINNIFFICNFCRVVIEKFGFKVRLRYETEILSLLIRNQNFQEKLKNFIITQKMLEKKNQQILNWSVSWISNIVLYEIKHNFFQSFYKFSAVLWVQFSLKRINWIFDYIFGCTQVIRDFLGLTTSTQLGSNQATLVGIESFLKFKFIQYSQRFKGVVVTVAQSSLNLYA